MLYSLCRLQGNYFDIHQHTLYDVVLAQLHNGGVFENVICDIHWRTRIMKYYHNSQR